MKAPKLTLTFLLFSVALSFAQVGVNTTSPQRDLDINGGLRIRSASDVNADNTYDRVLLMDSDGANTVGNVDYNSIDDFRSKIIDFSKLTITEINQIKEYLGLPKCIKGLLPAVGSAHPDIISFASGYEFRYKSNSSNGEVQVTKPAGGAVKAHISEIGGDISTSDVAFNIDNTWEKTIRVAPLGNDVGMAILIIADTAETFKIELAHKSVGGGNKVFSLCVSQTVK